MAAVSSVSEVKGDRLDGLVGTRYSDTETVKFYQRPIYYCTRAHPAFCSVQRKVLGRAITQASAARVRAQVRSYEISGEQSGTEAGSLRVLRFLLKLLISPLLHTHHPGLVQYAK
jgi:hypothetical protein